LSIPRNLVIDHWYYNRQVNVIPINAIDKKPKIDWLPFKNNRIPKELYETWTRKGYFDEGYGIILGRTYSSHNATIYLIEIDCNKQQAIKEFLTLYGKLIPLKKLSAKYKIEQRQDDLNSLRIYFLSPIPFPSKVSHETLGLEVKNGNEASDLMIISASLSIKDNPWKVLGTNVPPVITKSQAIFFMNHIDIIYSRYGVNYLGKDSGLGNPAVKRMIKTLLIDENANIIINDGFKHSTLLYIANSILFNHLQKDEKNIKELRQYFEEFIEAFCKSMSLPQDETNSIWESSTEFVRKYKDFALIKKHAIFDKILDKNLIEYVCNVAKKTIKQEGSLINLLLYTGLSTYTKNPLNLGIIAPISEGKTYPVTEMMKFLPPQDVWMVGSMSPKVIIRDRGIQVDENNEPIEQTIMKLTDQLKIAKESGNKKEEINLNTQLKEIHKNSKVLIDLSGKVLVFLEPPHQETWDLLKPILSHDNEFIEHPYVFKSETGGQTVKHIVTKGWPACIFCSAKDESNWPTWPEIQSRFFITSPNMIKQKYLESTILIGQRIGLPSLVQEQLIVASDEVQLAKDCLTVIKDELLKSYNDGVWIPYQKILSLSLPSEKGTDVRIANRVFSLLEIVTKSNSFNRFKLKFGKESMSISSLEDLKQVLKLTQNITGIPSYKLDFFKDVFIPLFQSKDAPVEKEDGTIKEDRLAVYTSELADLYKEKKGKSITVDAIKKTYLEELRNNGLIDEFESKIDRRKKGYYPIVDVSLFQQTKYNNYKNIGELSNNLHYFKLCSPKNSNLVAEEWLKVEILELLRYGIGTTNVFQINDSNNEQSEICICKFIENYESSTKLKNLFQPTYDEHQEKKIFGELIPLSNERTFHFSSNSQTDST
jgi:hypothetical protein